MAATSLNKHGLQRVAVMDAIDAELYPEQLAVIDSPHRRNAQHWGRRTGKSETIPRAGIRAACLAPEGSSVILGAETKDKAAALYWGRLLSLLHRHKLVDTWKTDGSNGTITTPWGATIRIWGAKDNKQIELLRGFSPFEVHFDEVASYFPFLRNLSTRVLGPALMDHRNADRGGRLFFWGTPSETMAGYWYDICSGAVPGWHPSGLDVRSNPFYDDPSSVFAEAIVEEGWVWDGVNPLSCMDPTFLREWRGLFVTDPTNLIYPVNPDTNLLDAMPADYNRDTWLHTLAQDFGVTDACAWAVWGSHPHRQEPVLLEVLKPDDDVELLPEEASTITHEFVEKYDPDVLVGDGGGLGKTYILDWNRRGLAPIQMIPAEKADKRGNIKLLDGELRSGKAKAVKATCQAWIDEASCLKWKDEFRLHEDPRFANHACDAVLYGFRHHTAYLNAAPKQSAEPDPRPTPPDWLVARRERLAGERRSRGTDGWWDD